MQIKLIINPHQLFLSESENINYFLANQKKATAIWLAMDRNAAPYIQKGKDDHIVHVYYEK